MSFKALNWARELKLRGSQKPVLSTLASYADEEGSCYPGQDLLADDTGFSVRTVRRCLESLERQGLILRQARYDQRGHRTSDRYYLQLTVTVLPTPEPLTPVDDDIDPADPDPDDAATTSTETGDPPVDNSPTGQNDRRSSCPSLPANLSIPTGQPDRHIEVEPSVEPPGEPSGGADAPAPHPTCGQHPNGTSRACRPCGDARRLFDAHQQRQQIAADLELVARRAPRYDPDRYCPHLQRRDGSCDACQRENRTADTAQLLQVGGVR